MSDWIEEKDGLVLVRVKVKPRSGKDKIEPPAADGPLPVRLAAPPVDNKANAALIALFAKVLRIPKSSISIKAGAKSRNKTLLIEKVSIESIKQAIASAD